MVVHALAQVLRRRTMDGGQWLTYEELGARLGTSAAGARRRAQRAHYPRSRGNDGRARVRVPDEALADLEALRGSCASDAQADDNPVHAQIARLEGELAGLREALAEARARADAAEANAEAAQARVDAEAAKTALAIRAFERLAERLEAMAEAQNARTLRHWWRRIVLRG